MCPDSKKYYVSVVGNIGAGKTTFAQMLAGHFNWKVYHEKVINNPYLPDYYADMKKWSFHLQIYFFSQRFSDQMQILKYESSGVTDRSIYEDPEVFARLLNQQGHLSDRDFKTYLDLFKVMEPFLPQPNLYIYLRASTWTLMSRIRNRGRKFEMGIKAEFIHQLNLAYENWIKHLSRTNNLIVVDTDRFHIEKDVIKRQNLLKIIGDHLESPSAGSPTTVV